MNTKNYGLQNYYFSYQTSKNFNSISFKAAYSPDSLLIKTAQQFSRMGQIESDLIKASGKALLSPLFILNNPFINQEKKSRKYSAALQPIEAVLAFVCSAVINLSAGFIISKLARKNSLGYFLNPVKNPVGMQNLKIFKDRFFVILTLITIPLTSSLINYFSPAIIKKIFPEYFVNTKVWIKKHHEYN